MSLGPLSVRPGQTLLWHGPALLVVDPWGNADDADPMSGFYFRETRFLRRLLLEVNGVRPWPCSTGQPSQRELLVGLSYPEVRDPGGSATPGEWPEVNGVPWRALDLMLRYRLRFHQVRAELTLTNRSEKAVEVTVEWKVSADYADLLEVPTNPPALAPVEVARHETTADGATLRLRHRHEQLPFETVIHAAGETGWNAVDGRLSTRLTLNPRTPTTVTLLVTAHDVPNVPTDAEVDERERRHAAWRRRVSRVSSPGDNVPVRIVNQALDDLGSLSMLEGESDEWLTPSAGMPRYPGLWGRDAITTAWQASAFDRGDMLDAVLTRLGRLQGSVLDPHRDEEPGRIIHSVRRGPKARLGESPYDRYYGDFASPLLFVIGLAQLYAWTGDRKVLDQHWDTARRVLDWAREYGDRDGDGYLEYCTRSKDGPENQGWKDSGESMLDELGARLTSPVATCEVQGYWFAALQLSAALSAARGQMGDARAFWKEAQDLKTRFNRDWWLEDEHFIGLGMDRDKRLSRSVTSNPGHCLASGIVSDDHVPHLVGRFFRSDLWSGWGVRTLSSGHPSYNPIGYHLGSIWAVENATLALGLRRYGYDARALDVAGAVFDLAGRFDHYRVPESIGGYSRGEWAHPGAYPQANPVQSWNLSAPALLLQVMLGMEPVAPLNLLVVNPMLPSWLPEVILEGLRVGGATATIRFWRESDFTSHAEVLSKSGTLHLLRQQPPESRTATVRDRVTAFVDGLVHA